MADNREGKFRERFTEIGGGIKVEQPKRPALPTTDSLKVNTSVDLSQLDSFTAAAVEIKGVAEKIKPQGAGDLRVATDLGKLDESLEKIRRQQTNEKIRGLVNEAEQLIKKKQYRPALKPLNKALGIDSTSTQVMLLKGYCLYSLHEYDPALAVLEAARQYARDGETVLVILMLQAACMRAAAQQIEAKITALLEKKQYAQALALIEGELRRSPSSAALLYYRCGVLLIMGRVPDAKRAATDALQRVDAENVELFQDFLQRIAVQENEQYLEAARLALRRGDPARALQQLQICREVLAGSEQYEAIRAYAEEQKPRGLLGAFFSRDRAKPLTDQTRQKLLEWLLAEELESGFKAIEAEKYEAAMSIFEKALRVDSRCKIICFLHAGAIFRHFRETLERQDKPPDLDGSIQNLERAAALVRLASSDQVVAEQSTVLLKVITNDIAQLQDLKREISRRAMEEKPLNDLIQEFNALMDSLERNSISSASDLDNAEKRFRTIKQKAEKLRKGLSRGQGRDLLDQLIAAVDRNLGQLNEVRGELSKNWLVNECVTGFTAMMEHFTKHPISSRKELESARSTVTTLKAKVAKARNGHQYGSEAWKVLDEVEEALQRVEGQLYY